MGDLLSIRLDRTDKEVLSFTSRMTETPASKVIGPFLSEGIRISQGSLIMFQIDRSTLFRKERYLSFVRMLIEPSRAGSSLMLDRDPEIVHSLTPRIIWEFFDLLSEERVIQKFSATFEGIEIQRDMGYVSAPFLRTLTYHLGESYISASGSLERLDYQRATSLYFHLMLHYFYRFNAKGTAKALNTQWYTHQAVIQKIEDAMMKKYSEKIRLSVVEAIVVPESKGVADRARGRHLPARNRSDRSKAPRVVRREKGG